MSRRRKDKASSLRRLAFWRKAKEEDGNATVEFVIIFPVFMALFLSSFELGLYMTRQVMLDRATDLTVRALRLGQFDDPTQELLRYNICRRAAVVDNCQNRLLIEMTPIPTDTWQALPNPTQCIDREEDIDPVITFNGGQANDLMLIRVCALLDPFFPTTRLAMKMPDFNGYYALVTTSAFVNEPDG